LTVNREFVPHTFSQKPKYAASGQLGLKGGQKRGQGRHPGSPVPYFTGPDPENGLCVMRHPAAWILSLMGRMFMIPRTPCGCVVSDTPNIRSCSVSDTPMPCWVRDPVDFYPGGAEFSSCSIRISGIMNAFPHFLSIGHAGFRVLDTPMTFRVDNTRRFQPNFTFLAPNLHSFGSSSIGHAGISVPDTPIACGLCRVLKTPNFSELGFACCASVLLKLQHNSVPDVSTSGL
jgi:hypothetical protein